LKPVTRRVWAPIGKRPIALGHHRFDWLYVTAFVSPATGETFWYVHDGVSKPFFVNLPLFGVSLSWADHATSLCSSPSSSPSLFFSNAIGLR
jgi:hypothetical protein